MPEEGIRFTETETAILQKGVRALLALAADCQCLACTSIKLGAILGGENA